jgi:hypothetical protein
MEVTEFAEICLLSHSRPRTRSITRPVLPAREISNLQVLCRPDTRIVSAQRAANAGIPKVQVSCGECPEELL